MAEIIPLEPDPGNAGEGSEMLFFFTHLTTLTQIMH
jgi:hypothetical protein